MLGLTYFLYFGQLGVLVPYLGVFLDGRGFSSVQIGELLAIITLARIIGPIMWANLADKKGKTLAVLRLGTFLTMASFSSVFWFDSFWGMTLSFSLMMMFWTAVLPQLEVITMQCIKAREIGYGLVRLWGSIGFILLTVLVGWLLDFFSTETPVVVSLFVLVGLWLVTLLVRQPPIERSPSQSVSRLGDVVRSPVFIAFIVSATLLQFSFGSYYGFFSLYMRDLSYSGQETGMLIALGVVAEVGIFLAASRLISVFGVWNLLVFSMLATALRWFILGYLADHLVIVMLSQLIHALSFGLTHAVSVHFIHQFFAPEYHSRAQAIYISVAFGIGGAAGSFVAGNTWMQGDGATLSFALSGIAAAIGGVALLFVPPKIMNGE